MSKQILTIGYEIPGQSDDYVDFDSNKSLMDADILLLSPKSFMPSYNGWVSFSSGGGCFDPSRSDNYEKKISHLKKELGDYLNSGKTVFLLLTEKESFYLSSGTTSPRKGERNYSTYSKNNYSFLPVDIGTLTSASGKIIEFSGNSIFSDFYKKFNKNLEYRSYIEGENETQILFTGKDKAKILGAIYKVGKGHLIALPYLKYDENKFTKYDEKKDETFWTEDAMKFGYKLKDCLFAIDQQLTNNSEKTPPPEWASKKEFSTKKALLIEKKIEKNKKEIKKIKTENEKLEENLVDENSLKDLLFEQSKPLERAVIKALKILGYQAENYDDGELEIDQVIISPEKIRYIGECEGKDTKDINITKFRQLVDALNADFARDEIEDRALGILFGNPERLTEPKKRKLDFTQKCKTGAKREKIALIKTTDLFVVAKYLSENKNAKFKKDCRNAIHKALGKIVEFPEIPKK